MDERNKKKRFLKAAEEGNIEVLRTLLCRGVYVDSRDTNGNTALMKASYRGDIIMVSFLISNRADVNAENKWGHNALVQAIENDHANVASILLLNGSNIEDIREYELTSGTLLHGALNHLYQKNKGGDYPLPDYLGVISVLILADINMEYPDNAGYTALHFALTYVRFYNFDKAVNILVVSGANVNAKTRSGTTPLMIAAEKGNLDIIELLVSNGANLHERDTRGRSALDYAISPKIRNFFFKHGVKSGIARSENDPWDTTILEKYTNDGNHELYY